VTQELGKRVRHCGGEPPLHLNAAREIVSIRAVTRRRSTDGIGRRGQLLRQYLKLGGKLLGLNVAPEFLGPLDGLIVVDRAGPNLRR
jgi:hypothetical protein